MSPHDLTTLIALARRTNALAAQHGIAQHQARHIALAEQEGTNP